jgi:hypothetical protein
MIMKKKLLVFKNQNGKYFQDAHKETGFVWVDKAEEVARKYETDVQIADVEKSMKEYLLKNEIEHEDFTLTSEEIEVETQEVYVLYEFQNEAQKEAKEPKKYFVAIEPGSVQYSPDPADAAWIPSEDKATEVSIKIAMRTGLQVKLSWETYMADKTAIKTPEEA